MPRQVNLSTREMGVLPLYLIYENDGEWETYWRPLQGLWVTPLFTYVSKEMMDHALHGWTQPFVKALGLRPDMTLRKLPTVECHQRNVCIYYNAKECKANARSMPWCFEPTGIETEEVRRLAGEVVQFWRSGVHVVIVQEGS